MKVCHRLITLLTLSCLAFATPACSQSPDETQTSTTAAKGAPPVWGDLPNDRPSCIRGIHLTSWYTGTKKGRARFEKLLADTEINTVVIDIKESEGDVYIPGVKLDGKPNFVNAMPDIKEYIKYLKDRGIYVIARQTIFHDNKLAREKPEWAIRSSSPIPKAAEKGYRADVWVDKKGSGWADGYNPEVWKYNIDIAEKAGELGFQEVQFDYVRFPSDGQTKLCVYSKPHSSATAVKALEDFLERAHTKLKAQGVGLSIDVFGLVGSSTGDLGIGQKLDRLIGHVDAISPMMYPSHYYAGEFGIKDPNSSPYETIYHSIRDTKRVVGNHPVELRPWLQDFSLGVKYDGKKIRDQIDAAADLGVNEWLLWNPACRYTRGGLMPPMNEEEKAEEAKRAAEEKKEKAAKAEKEGTTEKAEKPVEHKPAEKTVLEKKTTEKKPAEKKPVLKKPVEKKTTEKKTPPKKG